MIRKPVDGAETRLRKDYAKVRIYLAHEVLPSLAKWSNFIRYESRKKKEGEADQPGKKVNPLILALNWSAQVTLLRVMMVVTHKGHSVFVTPRGLFQFHLLPCTDAPLCSWQGSWARDSESP